MQRVKVWAGAARCGLGVGGGGRAGDQRPKAAAVHVQGRVRLADCCSPACNDVRIPQGTLCSTSNQQPARRHVPAARPNWLADVPRKPSSAAAAIHPRHGAGCLLSRIAKRIQQTGRGLAVRTRLILHFNGLPAIAWERVAGGPQDAAVSAALDAAEDHSVVGVRKQLRQATIQCKRVETAGGAAAGNSECEVRVRRAQGGGRAGATAGCKSPTRAAASRRPPRRGFCPVRTSKASRGHRGSSHAAFTTAAQPLPGLAVTLGP